MLQFLRTSGLALLLASGLACSSSSSEGDVKCSDDGVCEPKPVFVSGRIKMILVTPETVYAADGSTCGVFAATKPIEEAARVLARDACGVASLARTDWGIYWSTLTRKDIADKDTKGVLAWVPDGQTTPTVIDAALERPGGIAAIGDTVFVAVADGIRMLQRGSNHLERVVEATEPHALRSFQGALYWHDALGSIYSWRSGDPKPSQLVRNGFATSLARSALQEDRFVVDASGLYWVGGEFFGAADLVHAPLAGGKPEKLVAVKSLRGLAIDEGALYWAEADSFLLAQKTTIHRIRTTPGTSAPANVVVAEITAEVQALQSTPEGLYVAASPTLELDKNKPLGFKAYGGPLLMLPRQVLDQR